MKVTTVIVTYNREYDIIRCLDAVCSQSRQSDAVIIVDNASSDNTVSGIFGYCNVSLFEFEKEKLVNICPRKNIWLIIKKNNTGGAGGFYTGLKLSHEFINSDYTWLMDDDGYPSGTCLEKLLVDAGKFDYVMPVSIDIKDHDRLSWATRKPDGKKTIRYNELKDAWGSMMDYVTPFNGALLSRKCISRVGYTNKDFFIWGDEYEHWWRCKKAGFSPATDMNALFYHPAAKLPLVPICLGLFHVPYADSRLRMICLARNYTYIYLHFDKKIKIVIKFLMYTWLFLVTRKGDFSGWKLYCQSVADAFRNDFSRHLNYIK